MTLFFALSLGLDRWRGRPAKLVIPASVFLLASLEGRQL
jgi:hypothetical protein